MRIGIIGFGRAAQLHAEAWRRIEDVELLAASDPSVDSLQTAEGIGLRPYSDAAEMISSEGLDAVSVCAPPAVHSAMAIECLERGLHVLCEKPLALTTSDARDMMRTASRVNRRLVLATKFRHVPDLIEAQRLIASGALGDPISFEINFSSHVNMSNRWNSRPELAGGGVIVDNGCHALDIASFLFGSVVRVQATSLKPVQWLEVEDSATIQVHAANGVYGRVDLSWSLDTGQDSYVKVYGSEGVVEVGWKSSRIRRAGGDWKPLPGGRYDKVQAHVRMFRNFRDAVAVSGETQPWISPVECVRTVAAVEAAYRSLESCEWEAVETRVMPDFKRAVGARG